MPPPWRSRVNPRQCGGLIQPLPMSLSEMAAELLRWAGRAAILQSLWDILCATFGEKMTG